MSDWRERPITMQDVRLAVGEGKLSNADVLAGCNAEMRRRGLIRPTPPREPVSPAELLRLSEECLAEIRRIEEAQAIAALNLRNILVGEPVSPESGQVDLKTNPDPPSRRQMDQAILILSEGYRTLSRKMKNPPSQDQGKT